jgi:hypothetical protein
MPRRARVGEQIAADGVVVGVFLLCVYRALRVVLPPGACNSNKHWPSPLAGWLQRKASRALPSNLNRPAHRGTTASIFTLGTSAICVEEPQLYATLFRLRGGTDTSLLCLDNPRAMQSRPQVSRPAC